MTDDPKRAATEAAEGAIDAAVAALEAQGVPLEVVVAVLHASAVSAMAGLYGGAFAAARCRSAAARVEGLSTAPSPGLAMARPIGRA